MSWVPDRRFVSGMSDRGADIPSAQLDSPVSDIHLAEIAREYLRSWEELAPRLELTPVQEEEIRNTYGRYGDQKLEALRLWRRIKGSTATYRALIAAAVAISNEQLADNIRSLLIASGQPTPLVTQPPQPILPITPQPTLNSAHSVAAMPLSLEDTQDVFEAMYEARDKWQNIGGVFRVPDSSLSSIAQEESSSDRRLRRVIRSWLEKCAGTLSATWAEVARTLGNVTVGRDDLARKVEEEHLQHTLQPSQGGISTSMHVTTPPHVPPQVAQVRALPSVAPPPVAPPPVVPPQPVERPLSKPQCTQRGLRGLHSCITPLPLIIILCPSLPATDDLLDVSGYLANLNKRDVNTLGQVFGLSHITINNNYEGSTRVAYVDAILTAWFLEQDRVGEKGQSFIIFFEDARLPVCVW